MNVVAMHRTSLAVINFVEVDSITFANSTFTIHGKQTTNTAAAATYTLASADYLVSIMGAA